MVYNLLWWKMLQTNVWMLDSLITQWILFDTLFLKWKIGLKKEKRKKIKIVPYHCAYSNGITTMVLDIDTFRLDLYKIDTHTVP